MTSIYTKKIDGPATHAIVIGVGAYSHLLGGDGTPFEDHEGMGQLTSPSYSAREFANWLLSEYYNPDKPLASISLLISDASNNKFTFPDGTETKIEKANMTNVKKALRCWIDLGDENQDNRLIFFFCGHGIASGLFVTLLLEDFGEYKHSPLDNAIDFNSFYRGMEKCKAREQCYFVDACRIASPILIESLQFAGDPIIGPSAIPSDHGTRSAPIYYSTVPGVSAYGRPKATSVFTEALIKAFRGAGSDDYEGDWRVYPERLYRGILHLIERMLSNIPSLEQVILVSELSGSFAIHYLKEKPIVPITVGCKPKIANEVAQLALSNDTTYEERPSIQSSDWYVDIMEGEYIFSAKFSRSPYLNKDVKRAVRPPFRRIKIEVSSR